MRVLLQVSLLVLGTASALFAQQPGAAGRGAGRAVPSGNRPLIIVDGVVVSAACEELGSNRAGEPSVRINGANMGRIAGLGPNEIEQVEVLKGNAAAAYGPRAANGVILITTKKGNHYCLDRSPALDDPFASHLFPPELIMEHQRELALQDAQRATIVGELERSQATFVQLQWKMSGESEQLETLLASPTVNEAAVLAQIDRVLAVEREIKRAQIALLVRIKNTLSAEQQARLTELRSSAR
jgi:TonB-dependent SusC/RagA subfamily outer membrane receptor